MPVVETTIIQGYDDATKARLLKGMMRVVRSVMAAPPEGIVTVIKELAPSSYARGGVSRVPGPPLPPATEVAAALATALSGGDAEAAGKLVADGFVLIDDRGLSMSLADALASGVGRGKRYQHFVEALTDEGSLVFGHGIAEDSGARFIDRFRLTGPRIVELVSWGASA